MFKNVLRAFCFIACLSLQPGFAADYPLYVRFIPYAPPNLHLMASRATNAYYIPNLVPSTTYNFSFTPVLTSTLSLAQGPVPVTLQFLNSIAACTGSKVITATLRYNISGAFVTVGSQTQTINVVSPGALIQAFAFSGITATQNYTLQAGDYMQLQITHEATGTGQACLVNEFPLGGVDTDASKITLQTGPLLSIQKLKALVSDPINATTDPKSIPGAVIHYTVNITNDATASTAANSVDFNDDIPAGTTYLANSIRLNGVALTDATGDDAGGISGSTISIDTGNIAAGQTIVVEYDVTVD